MLELPTEFIIVANVHEHTVHNKHYSNFIFLNYSLNKVNLSINPRFIFDKPVEVTFSLKKNVLIKEHVTQEQSENSSNDNVEKEATIIVECFVFEDAEENNYPFSLYLEISGEFKYIGVIGNEEFQKFCEMNGIATLLPYLRSSITNITATANIQPLVLPLINIYSLVDDKDNSK